jgi:hypothetical protein
LVEVVVAAPKLALSEKRDKSAVAEVVVEVREYIITRDQTVV